MQVPGARSRNALLANGSVFGVGLDLAGFVSCPAALTLPGPVAFQVSIYPEREGHRGGFGGRHGLGSLLRGDTQKGQRRDSRTGLFLKLEAVAYRC